MEGKDLLLQLEDENVVLAQRVAEKEQEIGLLREQLRQRDLALDSLISPLAQTPLPERSSPPPAHSRAHEMAARLKALEGEQRALRREIKALQEIDVRKSKALEELDRAIKLVEEERDLQKLKHAQEISRLKAQLAGAQTQAQQHERLEREHSALEDEYAAMQLNDEMRVKDWMAERRRLKEQVHHEQQAKIAAQDNAAKLRAKYVAAREQLDMLRVSLRNCTLEERGRASDDGVTPLSPPFGVVRAQPNTAGSSAVGQGNDGEWAPVPYEIYAQLEAEVRHLRKKTGAATSAHGMSPSAAVRPASARTTPSASFGGTCGGYPIGTGVASRGSRAAKSSPHVTSPTKSITGTPQRPCSTPSKFMGTPYDVVHQHHSPYWEDLSNDLLRSVSELMPAPAEAPFSPPRGAVKLGLFGTCSSASAQENGTALEQQHAGAAAAGTSKARGCSSEAQEAKRALKPPLVERIESDGWPVLSNATHLGAQVRPPATISARSCTAPDLATPGIAEAAPAVAAIPSAEPATTAAATWTPEPTTPSSAPSTSMYSGKPATAKVSPASAKAKKGLPVNWRR